MMQGPVEKKLYALYTWATVLIAIFETLFCISEYKQQILNREHNKY